MREGAYHSADWECVSGAVVFKCLRCPFGDPALLCSLALCLWACVPYLCSSRTQQSPSAVAATLILEVFVRSYPKAFSVPCRVVSPPPHPCGSCCHSCVTQCCSCVVLWRGVGTCGPLYRLPAASGHGYRDWGGVDPAGTSPHTYMHILPMCSNDPSAKGFHSAASCVSVFEELTHCWPSVGGVRVCTPRHSCLPAHGLSFSCPGPGKSQHTLAFAEGFASKNITAQDYFVLPRNTWAGVWRHSAALWSGECCSALLTDGTQTVQSVSRTLALLTSETSLVQCVYKCRL